MVVSFAGERLQVWGYASILLFPVNGYCEEMAKRKESVNFHRQKQLIDIITVVFYFDLLSRRYARKYFY
jgi:hypothetical protein